MLIKIGGAGVCHSDLHILDHGLAGPTSFTLGHENAGWVAELGQGATGWKEGDAGRRLRPLGLRPVPRLPDLGGKLL